MNVLLYSDEYYPTPQACSYRMEVFADVLAAHGHHVTVLASAVNRNNGAVSTRPERILYAPAVRMRKKTALMRLLNHISFALSSVFVSLRTGPADVVLCTSPPLLPSMAGWAIARMKGAKLVFDVRDIWPDIAVEMGSLSEGGLIDRAFRWTADFLYRRADLVTTVSQGKAARLSARVEAICPSGGKKVVLVPNGFDRRVENGNIDPAIVQAYELDDAFTCVYIGNIGVAQGMGQILDLAAKRPDVRFLLFGKGAEREMLEQQADSRKLSNVRFCGVLPHEQVYTVLKKAKISLIPLKSAAMQDSVPTKVYEALGLGCPVLLIAEGDAVEIVRASGLGRCVSPDEPEKLPAVLDEMTAHYEEITRNRETTQIMMRESFSRQASAERMEQILRELVK